MTPGSDGANHRVKTVSGEEIEVLTVTDLQLMLGRQAQTLLRWILGTGLGLAIAATLLYAKMENRLSGVEHRNATDSTLISDLKLNGSDQVRNLSHDLGSLAGEIADLKTAIRELQAQLVDHDKWVKRRGGS
jgi:hypothetical protein